MVTDLVGGLERRLPWLLVFRGIVATGLLLVTLAAEVTSWQVRLQSAVLYGAVVSSYLVVVILGLLLRGGISPVVLSAVHLTTTVMAAAMVVQATGGVESGLTFLYLLVILDGAIIGGRAVALAVATAASLVFGVQLVLQLYGVFPAGLLVLPPPSQFVTAVVTHLIAYYLIALLAGRLAFLFESARAAISDARIDLQRIEAFQVAVLASLPVGVLTVGGNGRVRTANPAAGRILGGSAEDLIDQPLPKALASELASERPVAAVRLGDDGRHLAISRASVRFPLGTGRATRDQLEIVVLEDRTELQELYDTLRARERLASLGEMAAGIAHELRNPLAAISGSVELLRSEPESTATRERLETIVLREIERLNELVNEFLTYARPAPVERSPTDLASLARELKIVFEGDPSHAQNPLVVEAPATLEVSADAGQVRQMLWNLLRNAVEASPADASVELLMERQGDLAVIRVRDRGPGVDPAVRARLFEPFQTTKHNGTGLGLAIVHNIVSAHEGEITLTGRDDGNGTVARVELPLKRFVPGEAGR